MRTELDLEERMARVEGEQTWIMRYVRACAKGLGLHIEVASIDRQRQEWLESNGWGEVCEEPAADEEPTNPGE